MPNWCSTNIKFTGEQEKLRVLHDFINDDEANKKVGIATAFRERWLGNYLERAGFSWKDYRCRGTVEYISDVRQNEFTVETETAWAPMLAMWQAIVEKIAPELEITYFAQEPGCGVYMTNDPEKADNYWVDVYDEDNLPENVANIFHESFDTTEVDLRGALLQIFPSDAKLETDKLIQKLEDMTDEIGINKWKYVPVSEVD